MIFKRGRNSSGPAGPDHGEFPESGQGSGIFSFFQREKIAAVLAEQGRGRTFILVLATLVMAGFAFQTRLDNSGVSFGTGDAESARAHQAFVRTFGIDDYLLLAVAHGMEIPDPDLRKRIKKIRESITGLDGILEVTDLEKAASTDLPGFPELSGPWTPSVITGLGQLLPGVSQLVSQDMKILGLVIRIDNERLNGFRLENRVSRIKKIIREAFPGHPPSFAAGLPVLRAAFERYNLINALIFGGLGLVFGTLVAFYLFKTLWASVLVLISSLISLVWVLGLMGLLGIRINLASGLSFGFVLIASCTTVFHILSAYQANIKAGHGKNALARTYIQILSPCFMCALTTAAGFFSLCISPVPMVRQAGVVIGLGVILSFCLALPLTSLGLPRLIKQTPGSGGLPDRLDRAARILKLPGFHFPRATLVLGLVFCLAMALGIPHIRTNRHLALPMLNRTPEAKEMAFIREHLSTGYSFSLVMAPRSGSFDSRQFWYDLLAFEKKIREMEGVESLDSVTPLVFRTALRFSHAGIMPEQIYQQIRSGMPVHGMITPFLDKDSGALRLVVHIRDQSPDQIEALLQEIKDRAEKSLGRRADITLAGQMIYLRSQTTGLVASQLRTLFLALGVITLFMMVQLRSPVLGLLSLVPNVLPLMTVFGVMGWMEIGLDPLTIFAAVISFGLSVDDSIHYLTAFRYELLKGGRPVLLCLGRAYDRTARALISTTAVLFFSSAGLVFSSFSHVFSLGVLVAAASLAALAGDLMVLPALVQKTGLMYKHRAIPTNSKQTGSYD
ncbi:efflux RND transporter permease subunit [Desulfospira joergensenii]|uniref:efflux RND transporter permease subunit n=1 Tax=Desulfospira joergensenii TaxID=53329 RepID=UPI0003FCF1DF|nr:MMPL family transporter [Desulfospira joergensenii]